MLESKRSWLFWSTIIFIILFISVLIYAIFLYMDLNEKRTAGFDDTRREVLNQTAITEISNIESFNGEASYHVVSGIDTEGEEKLIFYPLEGNEKTITTIDYEDITPKSAIINEWQANCNSCELINVSPALVDDEALWELTYYDENDLYVFEYVSIYDASPYEEIRYLRKFN